MTINPKFLRFLKQTGRNALLYGFFNLPTGAIPTGSGPDTIFINFFDRIGDIISALAYPLAFAGLVYSGYLLITSAGNPDAMQKAKKNITYIVTGIFFIIFAVIIFTLIKNLFTSGFKPSTP